MAKAGGGALVPKGKAEEVEHCIGIAAAIETAAAKWVGPTAASASREARTAAQKTLTAKLAMLNDWMEGIDAMVPPTLSLADIAVACSLLGLYQTVLSTEVQQRYQELTRWLNLCLKHPHFVAVLGEFHA